MVDPNISVEFENYVGPHLFYNSVQDIRSIGTYLASSITPNLKGDADYSGKYIISHRPKLEWEKGKKSCDIFSISLTALIDNIDNIELIISQYLIDNYGYSLSDSDLLAHLLVIYNAVYRGDVNHLNENYTVEGSIVDNHEFIGIDMKYFNWAGKTNIYIPLSDHISLGRLSNIDTDKVIDEKVIESIRINNDNNIELREDIVEFKEREYDEISNELDEDKESLELLMTDIDRSNMEALDNKVVQISEKEKDLDTKESRILELRDELSDDKNDLIVTNILSSTGNTFPYILNRTVGSKMLGQLVKISKAGNITAYGSVNTIRSSYYFEYGGYLYIIAGGDSANQLITLGRLDRDSLSLLNWARIPCYENSIIISNNKLLYSIIEVDGGYYIGEFDLELNLLRRSSTDLIKDSYILFRNDIFYIQGEYNSIKLVNLSDFISTLSK